MNRRNNMIVMMLVASAFRGLQTERRSFSIVNEDSPSKRQLMAEEKIRLAKERQDRKKRNRERQMALSRPVLDEYKPQ